MTKKVIKMLQNVQSKRKKRLDNKNDKILKIITQEVECENPTHQFRTSANWLWLLVDFLVPDVIKLLKLSNLFLDIVYRVEAYAREVNNFLKLRIYFDFIWSCVRPCCSEICLLNDNRKIQVKKPASAANMIVSYILSAHTYS